MATRTKRRSFEEGHLRKMLVIIDDSQEVEAALFFCASRIAHSSGVIVMLHVVEPPQDLQTWMGVQQLHIEEETNKAKARFRLFRRKLNQTGFENVVTEEVIRQGQVNEQITKLIDEDQDIGIMVLGAATDAKGPGPLVSSLAAGNQAGTFPIPITIVPGGLTLEELQALA
jgi:hypothetical protein